MSNLCRPEHTAIQRTALSAPARAVLRVLVPGLGGLSLLDHGCGRGADVAGYRAAGLDADGFDPHAPFGFARRPTRRYDLVTSVYVVNVLDDAAARLAALRDAAGLLKPGGRILVVSRSASCIEREAVQRGWERHSDGWWSNARRGMFQRGHTDAELAGMLRSVGLRAVTPQPALRLSAEVAWALAASER